MNYSKTPYILSMITTIFLASPSSASSDMNESMAPFTSKQAKPAVSDSLQQYLRSKDLVLKADEFDMLVDFGVSAEDSKKFKEAYTKHIESQGNDRRAKQTLCNLSKLAKKVEQTVEKAAFAAHKGLSHEEKKNAQGFTRDLIVKLYATEYLICPSNPTARILAQHFNGFGHGSEESEIYHLLLNSLSGSRIGA